MGQSHFHPSSAHPAPCSAFPERCIERGRTSERRALTLLISSPPSLDLARSRLHDPVHRRHPRHHPGRLQARHGASSPLTSHRPPPPAGADPLVPSPSLPPSLPSLRLIRLRHCPGSPLSTTSTPSTSRRARSKLASATLGLDSGSALGGGGARRCGNAMRLFSVMDWVG